MSFVLFAAHWSRLNGGRDPDWINLNPRSAFETYEDAIDMTLCDLPVKALCLHLIRFF